MPRVLFDRLLGYIEEDLHDESTRTVPPRDKLVMYLLFVGSGKLALCFYIKGERNYFIFFIRSF